jgi:hypothetical protein
MSREVADTASDPQRHLGTLCRRRFGEGPRMRGIQADLGAFDQIKIRQDLKPRVAEQP